MRLKQVGLAIDQLLNVLVGNGWADETLSARTYRNSLQGNQKWMLAHRWINRLFWWQKDHCRSAYMNELARMQMPPAYRVK